MGYFKSNSTAWLNSERQVIRRAENLMGETILQRAIVLAPELTGALKANGRVQRQSTGGISVIFGDQSVPYARIHELGGVTGRGHNTKITARHYLETAGDSVAKENIKKYVDLAR